MKVIQIIKKRIEKAKEKRLERIEKWLRTYYSRAFETSDFGIVTIPHFIKADAQVNELKKRGLLEIAYKQIKEGVA